jgi:hypothetical protein
MPPIIGRDPFHITEHAAAQTNFHVAFGQAFGQWALVEERLSYWFQDVTGLPYGMARALFFSPRVFQARTELLEVAIQHNARLPQSCIEFIKAATTKAGKMSSSRNQLAHGEQSFDARSGSPTFKEVILISGKKIPEDAADNAVTVSRLEVGTGNFRELARLLMDVTEFVHQRHDPSIPAECLRLLNELPNQADSPRLAQSPSKP